MSWTTWRNRRIVGPAKAGKEGAVAILTEDMKRVVRDQRLGFHATVDEDGSPNLSPKGTTDVWDDDHLYFAHICSPQTVANIRRGSLVEINVVDPFVRKGYRFKGPGVVHEPGTESYAEGLDRMRAAGLTLHDRVKAIVVIEVRQARALVSPAYDDGTVTEADLLRLHQARFARLHGAIQDGR
jgi:predicted pyridoxine 5'-phosphate oxidase superfamily flavin-nucleotide-binding protein